MKNNVVSPLLLAELSINGSVVDGNFDKDKEENKALFYASFTMLDDTDEVAAWFKITNRASDALKN